MEGLRQSFSQTGFEPSPLDRVVEQGFAGAAWQVSGSGDANSSGHTVRAVYTQNDQSTAFNTHLLTNNPGGKIVALYTTAINYSTQTQRLVRTGNVVYSAGQLFETITRDENWQPGNGCLNSTEAYTDKLGHVVLKRTYNASADTIQMLSTYYVYDILGNLAFVLPPGATPDNAGLPAQTLLDNFCYQYNYDNRNREVAKKIPGRGWGYTIYDKLNQVIAGQDSVQRMKTPQQAFYTKYDALGRVVISGFYYTIDSVVGANNRAALQSAANAQTNLWETKSTAGIYSNATIPTARVQPLVTNYYDDYNINGLPPYVPAAGHSALTKGLQVASKTTVLNAYTNMLWAVNYYDDLGRNIESYNQHYLYAVISNSNYDLTATAYDFTNAPTTVTRQHFNTTNATIPLVIITNTYFYDHMGRKLSTWEQITNGNTPTAKTLISKTSYNELGQMLTKHLHGTTTDSLNFLQNVAYTYNERGWLLSSSAALFQMQLQYNTALIPGLGNIPQYNGNISTQSWGTAAAPNTTSSVYLYDNLNRLYSGSNTAGYTENNIVYDEMGNMSQLYRYNPTAWIDNLSYSYIKNGNPTNQLQSVIDNTGNNSGLVAGTTSYTYDANGNMLHATNTINTTQNKNFTYSVLNLPSVVTIPAGTATYTYDASGAKLRKVDVLGGVTTATDYIDGIQYDGAPPDQLDFIQTEEGKAVENGTSYDYTYYLGDNLGNTRVTFDTKTGSAVMVQQDDYYPFGLEILKTTPPPNPKNEYLYNKKELQEEFGEYDYGARFYDPLLGRWTTIDPKADSSRRWSVYNYVKDNPIRRIDPDGMRDHYFGDKGEDYGVDKAGDNGQVRIVTNTDEKNQLASKPKDELVDAEKVTSGFRTNTAALNEASSQLNGKSDGAKEQLSVVNNSTGKVVHASYEEGKTETLPDGTVVATTKVTTNTGGQYTSVHSHLGEVDGRGGSALQPGLDDPGTFSKFGMNIITGPLGTGASGTGAVFYNTQGDRLLQMTKEVLTNILSKLPQ